MCVQFTSAINCQPFIPVVKMVVFFFYFCLTRLQYLEDHAGQGFTKRGGQWSPLVTYKTALAGQEAGDNGLYSWEGRGGDCFVLPNVHCTY